MKYNVLKTSFAAGEIGKQLRARQETEQYKAGASKMLNMKVLSGGGAGRRSSSKLFYNLGVAGTQFKAQINFPYTGLNGERFLCTLRVETGAPDSYNIVIFNEAGTVVKTTTFSTGGGLGTFDTSYGFHYAQRSEVLIITHASGLMAPLMLRQLTSAPTFAFGFMVDTYIQGGVDYPAKQYLPPFKVFNQDSSITMARVGAGTLTGTAEKDPTSKTTVITCSATIFTDEDDWLDRFIMISTASYDGIYRVTDVTSTVTVTADIWVEADTGALGATSSWALSEWGGRADGGVYPKSVSVYQERFVFGGSLDKPGYMWATNNLGETPAMLNFLQYQLLQDAGATDTSKIGYHNGKSDASPFDMSIGSGAVTWLAVKDALLVGSSTKEFVVTGVEGAFTESGKQLRELSGNGSSPIMPIVCGNSIIYISENGKQARYVRYSYREYTNINMTVMNPEIYKHNATLLADENYREPVWTALPTVFTGGCYDPQLSTIWLRTSRGYLVSFRIDETAKTVGWTRASLGVAGASTEQFVDSVCLFNSKVHAITRTNCSATYYWDILQFTELIDNNQELFLERWTRYDGAAVTQLTNTKYANSTDIGLYYYATSDSEWHYGTVDADASGVFTLPEEATSVYYGFSFSSQLATLPLETGAKAGVSRGHLTRVDRLLALIYRTRAMLIGTEYSTEERTFSEEEQTQDLKLDIAHSYDREAIIVVQSKDIYDFNILGLGFKGHVQED